MLQDNQLESWNNDKSQANHNSRLLTSEINRPDMASNVPDSKPSTSPEITAAQHSKRLIWKWWLFEILASIISVASMIALILVLSRYEDTPLRVWRFNITLNGVVALLSTVCRTSLMIPVGAAVSQAVWLHYLPSRDNSLKHKELKHVETFNEASRGSFGSLKLLWSLRGR